MRRLNRLTLAWSSTQATRIYEQAAAWLAANRERLMDLRNRWCDRACLRDERLYGDSGPTLPRHSRRHGHVNDMPVAGSNDGP